MSHLPFHLEQLDFSIYLVSLRTESLNKFFIWLHLLGNSAAFFILISVIWIGFSYRWGLRLFYWLYVNRIVNILLKEICNCPRPQTDMPEIGLVHQGLLGLPSQTAQESLFLAGMLIYTFRTPWAWTIGIFYALLYGFSRLYLGAHYPLDLLVGWLIGALFLALYIYQGERIERFLIRKGPYVCLILALLLSLTAQKPYLIGVGLGIAIGTFVSWKYKLFLPTPPNIIEGLGRAFVALALFVGIVYFSPQAKSLYSTILMGLALSLVASPIISAIKKRIRI